MLGQIDFTARTTGIEFSQEVGQLFSFRGGKLVRSQDFLSHTEALQLLFAHGNHTVTIPPAPLSA